MRPNPHFVYSEAGRAFDEARDAAYRHDADQVARSLRIRARVLGLPPGCPVPIDEQLDAGWTIPPEWAVRASPEGPRAEAPASPEGSRGAMNSPRMSDANSADEGSGRR